MYKTALKYKNLKLFGVLAKDIEGYEDAISSHEKYVCHHVLEWKYSVDELKAMNRYENVTAEELMFVPASIHSTSLYLHKNRINSIKALTDRTHEQRVIASQKGAAKRTGQKRSDESKAKMSDRKKEYFETNPEAKLACGNSTRGKHWKLVDGKHIYYEV